MSSENSSTTAGNLVNVVQVVALFTTLGFFISGSATCMKIHRQKSVKNVNFLPYLTTLLNCFLWFIYGTLKHDMLLCVVNSAGCLFQTAYIFVFIQNCDNKHTYLRKLTVVTLPGCLFTIFVFYASETYNTTDLLGWISSSVAVLMFGSPLSTLKMVVQTKNSETISFPLSLMTVLLTGSWFLYGYLINDSFVQVPNFLGFLLGLLQIYLYRRYLPMKQGISV